MVDLLDVRLSRRNTFLAIVFFEFAAAPGADDAA
jgi:hypothetical protein